ncbi:MAG: hypothetical protein ACK4Z4_09340 [Ferrovibrio sp.]
MADTRDVTATDFARNFAFYSEDAIAKKVIRVTSHGRVIGAYLSASEAAHYERLKRLEQQSLLAGDLPDDVASALKWSEYGVTPK